MLGETVWFITYIVELTLCFVCVHYTELFSPMPLLKINSINSGCAVIKVKWNGFTDGQGLQEYFTQVNVGLHV